MNRSSDRSLPAAISESGEAAAPSGEGLLRRWSRRKLQARQETPAAPGVPEGVTATESPNPGAAPETPVLTDADMPPIESLDQDSDYTPFMSPGVSEALRTRALRRMFHSGLFNERCPLDSEYYDCHGYEPLGSVITHEMREEMERAAAALKEQVRQEAFEPDKPVAEPNHSGPEPVEDRVAASTAPDPGVAKEG